MKFVGQGRACRLSAKSAGREGSWAVGRRVSAEEVLATDSPGRTSCKVLVVGSNKGY